MLPACCCYDAIRSISQYSFFYSRLASTSSSSMLSSISMLLLMDDEDVRSVEEDSNISLPSSFFFFVVGASYCSVSSFPVLPLVLLELRRLVTAEAAAAVITAALAVSKTNPADSMAAFCTFTHARNSGCFAIRYGWVSSINSIRFFVASFHVCSLNRPDIIFCDRVADDRSIVLVAAPPPPPPLIPPPGAPNRASVRTKLAAVAPILNRISRLLFSP
mmetsp:Transcript_20893/g.49615  ORF Transcript_20893/g.49615 Transcript_20893/m.49615 type:complete len:218 (-) Transcript_20893:1034-1687(-)